ncbi:GPP34 family phosphoprotein [Pseudonocardia parietis]|uniref:GPP34 family phosphoprotein n=1 Tax=Pseudonocardia parietis TaxID=570936 RepID=UPI0035576A38
MSPSRVYAAFRSCVTVAVRHRPRLGPDHVVGHPASRVPGVFRTTRLPAADPASERTLRERLRGVLVTGIEPSAHDTLSNRRSGLSEAFT